MTVVIFDEMDAALKFFVIPSGDYSRFDRRYINSSDVSNELQQEMTDFLYDPKTSKLLHKTTGVFPVDAVRNGASVIVIGFLP